MIAHYILYLGPLNFGWNEPNKEDCELAENIRFDLIKRSAEEGYDQAFIPVGNRYNYGQGTSTDKLRAYMWYTIALKFGGWKDLRNDVEGLSYVDVLEANKLADECISKKYKDC